MTRLVVAAKLYEYVTRHPESDGWDRGDIQTEYNGLRVYLDRYPDEWAGYCTQEFYVNYSVTPGSAVFPVVVRYSTGDTFGRNDGNISVVGVYQNAVTASEIEHAIWDDYREHGGDFTTLKVAGEEIYTGTWKGYFEYLEDVFVETELVRV